MTQREKFGVNAFQKEAYKAYLELCIHLDEVPRADIVTLISGCTEISSLKESIDIFTTKKGKANHL